MKETKTRFKMEYLPIDVQREIIKFIPRHDSAQIIYDSRYLLSLKYLKMSYFKDKPIYKLRIWDELKPFHLRSVFYGDSQKITRTQISKGQYVRLKTHGLV
jgi:hypothetical protein